MQDIRQKLLATFQIEHRDHVDQIRSLIATLGNTGEESPRSGLDEAFRRAHSLKGAARAVDLQPVEGLAHRLETLFSRVRQGTLPLDANVTQAVQQALDASEDCVMALGDHRPTPGFAPALRALEQVLGMEAEASTPSAPAESSLPNFQPLELVRITANNFDGLLHSAGGLLGEGQRQEQLGVELSGLTRRIQSLEKQWETQAEVTRRQLAGNPGFSRIRAHLDSTERQTRELARQARSVRRLHQRSSWTISRLAKQLQLDVWRARMVPAESLLEGSRKVMRDLARGAGKQIEFRGSSTGVEADRRVLQALKDPILHLLRNAVSHGIEPPQERVKKGKSATGLVSLFIGSVGPRLAITIEDDGRGVDFARAAELAVGQGILSADEAALGSPRKLARILFQAGFSTAPSVTELSGRGMGLSVVQEAVRRLRGSVELRPRAGGGTVIHLSVPLSISTHKLLLADCGGQPIAIPVHLIERLHRINLESVSTVEGRPMIVLDRQSIPLVGLRDVLGVNSPTTAALDSSEPPLESALVPAAVLRLKSGLTAVAVDRFLGETDAVIQDLGSAARSGISGAILLEDGRIAMVINPDDLPDSPAPQVQTFRRSAPPEAKRAASSILVVDDSMTTRTLEKSILQAHGYRVQVAVDGFEALASLRKEKVDLVITDVQMPRLDGFGLLAAMKADSALNRIPVIVVTSLERREDQERGLQLGADAYIVKRKFDQVELLAAIRQIL